MATEADTAHQDVQRRDWLASLDYLLAHESPERARALLRLVNERAYRAGLDLPFAATTPYINTIPADTQPAYPGDLDLERRIRGYVRWNAMAMVVRANQRAGGIGGHLSTYSSAAVLWEVGFNHFFRARSDDHPGDRVYFQGHASPGVYARAFLEGRLSESQIDNFRRELDPEGGVSSYPHPWLMPEFWEIPSVSMGLAPIMATYEARFQRFLIDRGLLEPADARVWALIGDGEMDEPEATAGVYLAGREKLANLVYVINCNLQRLDGPVRGNGNIIQELEGLFRGAGWNVIKVLWSEDWDPLLQSDAGPRLIQRLSEIPDGEFQKYVVAGGSYVREHLFDSDPALKELVKDISDERLAKLRRGGHDEKKVYAAYKAAVETSDRPTVVLAQTIKGYRQGEAGEGQNISHKQKKLDEDQLRTLRDEFRLPCPDEHIAEAPFCKPDDDGEELRYLHERREALGGFVPARHEAAEPLSTPSLEAYQDLLEGGEKPISTTMAFVRLLSRLIGEEHIGERVVPIVPDEARTFGMESLFRQCGIYSHWGQNYEPVDREKMLYYREAKDGQILEEGITEAGCMSSFIAAGTSCARWGLHMIPFFLFYSIFGFQRVGDLIWAAGDSRCRGFLIGGTAGRTTLTGEGLQHQDGHSHLFASTYPTVRPYEPSFAYEVAVIVLDGIRRMYHDGEIAMYYITIQNENQPMPSMPEGIKAEDICRGLYRYASRDAGEESPRVQLLGSGSIMFEVLRAQEILAEQYDVASDVWSATSYCSLRRDALEAERWSRLHPGKSPRRSYLEETLGDVEGPFIAASDWVRAVPEQIDRWIPGGLTAQARTASAVAMLPRNSAGSSRWTRRASC